MESSLVIIQMKAIEQYFLAVLFTVFYKEVLTFASLNRILAYYHSNESYLHINFLMVLFVV